MLLVLEGHKLRVAFNIGGEYGPGGTVVIVPGQYDPSVIGS
jgi:hypothetical protein